MERWLQPSRFMKESRTNRPVPERTATDEGLRDERQRTDDELARTRAEHDVDVDRMLRETRTRMDRSTSEARELVNETLDSTHAKAPAREERVRAEEREDAAVATERASQDKKLARERAALERDVGALLRRERSETDERLLLERIRADVEIGSRDDFLAMVSHDLRGILHGIAMSGALLANIDADERTREAIRHEGRRIERFVGRMNRLIGDLLDISRLEAGKLEVILAVDDPAKLVQEAVDTARPLAEAKGLTLTCEAPGVSVRAWYDRERILQVLANLIGNALKFTSRGGRVDVSVREDGDEVCFLVADTGCGIPTEKLEEIFERFSQGSERDRSGLGLGLYISKRIVDAHAGRLWVESQPGEGSRFHFALPAAPPPPNR